VAVLWALLPAGCGPAHGPFTGAGGETRSLVRPLPDAAGIVVGPVSGVGEQQSRALREALVAALTRREIAAALSGDNPAIRRVSAMARIEQGAENENRLQIDWILLDPASRSQKTVTSSMTLHETAWQRPSPERLTALVEDAATAFAAALTEEAEGRIVSPEAPVRLYLWPVVGPREPLNVQLFSSLQLALQETGISVVDRLEEAQLIVSGEISLGQAQKGLRPIEIEWSMLKPDGIQIGRLLQRNRVADAELDTGWATLSRAVATAVAGSISDAIDRLPDDSVRR